jgi:putative ABC transport system permease protein
MIALSILRIAFDSLKANKLRSGLTLLGVIIGVMSVMTIISALEGMMGAIESRLQMLGPTTFVAARMGGLITSEEQYFEMLRRKKFHLRYKESIAEGCNYCEKISARAIARADIKYRNNSLRNVYVAGTDAEYIDIVELEVEQGRFFSYEEDYNHQKVAFIGALIQEELYPGLDPIGREISIGGQKHTVVGVAKKLGSMFGSNTDNFVVIPTASFYKQFGDPSRMGLAFFIKAVDIEYMQEAKDQIRMVLRTERHVPYDKPDDFEVLTADNVLQAMNSFTRILRFGLVGISSISLVVGGIVVMNIMMVSVTERTREIGIRKSLGAKQKHILVQFLLEALMTTISGGIIGIVIGFLIAKWLMGLMDMEITPSTLAIMAGFSVSTGIGLIFGIYPAMKAARMDPIKALSYE